MLRDDIPELPEINPGEYYHEDENLAIEEFKKADHKLMIYINEKGLASVFFNKLNHIFFAGFVVSISKPTNPINKLFEFLKLCLEGVRSEKTCTKKGHLNAVRVEKYLKDKTDNL
jgi:hypothetical protein